MQDAVGNEIFSGTIAFYNCLNQIFGHICVVGKKLLGIFGQAISAISETRVVVMCSNAGVEANAADDGLCVKTFHLGVCIQFVKIADPQGQVSVGK